MKKILETIAFVCILTFFQVLPVKATTIDLNVYTCPYELVRVSLTGGAFYAAGKHEIHNYNAYVNGGIVGKLFCMAPGKSHNSGSNSKCIRTLHPQESNKQDLDVALTVGYQELIDAGIGAGKGSNTSVKLGTALFRLIEGYYGKLDTGGDQNAVAPYRKDTLFTNSNYWPSWQNDTKFLKEIYQKAIEAGNSVNSDANKGKSAKEIYNSLVDSGIIWDAKWETKIKKVEHENDHSEILTIEIKNASNIEKVYWDDFTVSCEYGYKCNIRKENDKKLITVSENGKKAEFIIHVNTEDGKFKEAQKNNKAYGITLKTAWSDKHSAQANVAYYGPINSNGDRNYSLQNQLLLRNYGSDDIYLSDLDLVWDNDTCECKKDNQGKYYYEVTRVEKVNDEPTGKTTTEKMYLDDKNASTFEKNYHCSPDLCQEDENHKCEIVDGVYYGNDGSKLANAEEFTKQCGCREDNGTYYDKEGKVTTKKTYLNQCKKTCQKVTKNGVTTFYGPDPESEEDDNEATYLAECTKECSIEEIDDVKHYICSNGEECASEEQYKTECECGKYEKECKEGDSSSCEDYKTYCTNCFANVTLPSTCNDFDAESTVSGTISDINRTPTECNSSANQVKKCVIDHTDQMNNSFEATSIFKGNPYCKVWCDEEYNFTVPTAKYSQSGGYFELETTIKGTRNCYISGATDPSKGIDETKYLKDVKTAQQNLINAFNEYIKYKKAEESAPETVAEGASDEFQAQYVWYIYKPDEENKLTEAKVTSTFNGVKSTFTAKKDDAEKTYNNAKQALENVQNSYKQCTEWTNDMKFDPIIKYTYGEDNNDEKTVDNAYNDIVTKKEDNLPAFSEKSKTTDSKNVYCGTDVNDEYKCTGQSYNDEQMKENLTTTEQIVSCNDATCKLENKTRYTVQRVQKTVTNTGVYVPRGQFSTYTQYGAIKVNAEQCIQDSNGVYKDCLWTRLPDSSLPVSLRQHKGVFQFKFYFKNIGQNNTNGELGRLINDAAEDGKSEEVKSVIEAYSNLPEENKCGTTTPTSIDGGYVCHYINNCPTCHVTCEGGSCDITNDSKKDCPTCIVDGSDEIEDNDELTSKAVFRSVTTGNLFPNECKDGNTENCRQTGYNWNLSNGGKTTSQSGGQTSTEGQNSGQTQASGNTTDASKKAEVTRNEIEETGEYAYTQSEYSYTLTRQNMINLRKYNKAAGSYSNTAIPTISSLSASGEDAIYCENHTINGVDYSVNCKSRFLDIGEENDYFTENKRNEDFVLWTNTNYCQGGVCLDRVTGVGPSWK